MTIEVMRAVDHTYRHDLESFLYVLVWQCARNGRECSNRSQERPEDSLLKEWYTGSYEKIAARKEVISEPERLNTYCWVGVPELGSFRVDAVNPELRRYCSCPDVAIDTAPISVISYRCRLINPPSIDTFSIWWGTPIPIIYLYIFIVL